MNYRHNEVLAPSDVEYVVARAVDPEPFRRLLPGPKSPEDRKRRRLAVRRARRIIADLEAAGMKVVGQEQAEAQAREYGR